MRAMQEVVAEMEDFVRESKQWHEAQHCKYTDYATELATLREMANREFRECKESTNRQLRVIQESKKKLSELRTAARILRDHAKTAVAATAARDQAAPTHADEAAAAFHQLPRAARLAAVSGDGDVLRIAAVAAFLGALLAFSLLGEGFHWMRCR